MSMEEYPWHNSYSLGPFKLAKTLYPYPQKPLYDMLTDAATAYARKAAISFEGREIKYQELKLMADSLARALTRLGAEKGKSIVIFLPNCPQYIISDFAILRTGAVVTPISPLHKADEVEHELSQCGAEIIICMEDHLDFIESIKDKTTLQHIIMTSVDDYTSDEKTPAKIPGTLQFRDLIAEHEGEDPLQEPDINPQEDLAYLIFTGGSTGIPKGVMVTHYNRHCNVMQGMPWMYSPMAKSIKGKASVMIPIPLYHVYGHWMTHTAIYMGMRMILIPDPRDMDTIVEQMKEQRPMLVCMVPTQLMRLADREIGRMVVSIMSGAAPLPQKVADAVSAELKMPISEGYGLTEAGPLTHINLSAFSKITGYMRFLKPGIGVPIPDTEVKLIETDTGEDLNYSGAGELYLRGPQMMKGYWPEAGNGLTKDGWLATGDIAEMDDDGYFQIVDRVKDMAIISGYKVYTNTIDDILFKHPAVEMAAAIGVPDPERPGSERVKAFIKVKTDHMGKVDEGDFIEYCRDKVPPYAVPKFVEFREDLPMTVTEKLFKRELREEEIQGMKERGELE